MNETKIKYIKIIIYLIPLILAFWLLDKYFVFSGNLSSSYSFGDKPSIFSPFEPVSRVSHPEKDLMTGEKYQRIKNEQIYFSLNTPRPFKKAKFTILYNAPSQPIIKLGVKRTEAETSYEFKTIKNDYLDRLDKNWAKIYNEEQNIALLQNLAKENEMYSDIDKFIDNPPNNKTIGTYNFDLTDNKNLASYSPGKKYNEIKTFLKGSHKFYTYIKNEALDYKFKFIDLNNTSGPDDINIDVYAGINKVYSYTISDNQVNSDIKSQPTDQEYHLYIPNLEEGKYLIHINTTEDVVINNIITKQKHTVFDNKIFLAGNINSDGSFSKTKAELFSKSSYLKIKTYPPADKQSIKIANQKIEISSLENSFKYINLDNNDLTKIEMPEGNALIIGEYFTFDKSHFFDPNFGIFQVKLAEVENVNDVDYIIASNDDYQTPKKIRSWKKQEVEFDITNAYLDDGKLKFAINIPNFNHTSDAIIKDIKVKLTTDDIFTKIFNKFIKK